MIARNVSLRNRARMVSFRLTDVFLYNFFLPRRQLNIDDVKTTAQVILKADVQGSLDAIRFSIEGMRSKGMEVAIVGAGVGAVSEKDVRFAHTSNAVILGFNSKPDREANLLLRSYGDVIVSTSRCAPSKEHLLSTQAL